MKSHLRTDGFKVFEEDNRRLQLIMRNEDLNKSEAYRFALEFYERFHHAGNELNTLTSKVVANSELLKEIYFKLDVLGAKP